MRRQSILTQEAPQDSFSEWLYRNPTPRTDTLVPDAAQRSADNHLSEYVDRNGQSLAAGADNFIRLYHKAFYFS